MESKKILYKTKVISTRRKMRWIVHQPHRVCIVKMTHILFIYKCVYIIKWPYGGEWAAAAAAAAVEKLFERMKYV